MEIRYIPYTMEEIIEQQDEDGYISGILEVEIEELIGDYNYDCELSNIEFVMDRFAIRLIDSVLLNDISYEVVGVKNGNILIKVSGSVEDYIAWHTEVGDDYTV